MQEKLRKEIENVYDSDGKINHDKLIENEYLDQVFHEALRLHPPATIINRECGEAIELEGLNGKMHQLKVGDSINVPLYSIQRDPGTMKYLLSAILIFLLSNFIKLCTKNSIRNLKSSSRNVSMQNTEV